MKILIHFSGKIPGGKLVSSRGAFPSMTFHPPPITDQIGKQW
jgi:hypothetical protein